MNGFYTIKKGVIFVATMVLCSFAYTANASSHSAWVVSPLLQTPAATFDVGPSPSGSPQTTTRTDIEFYGKANCTSFKNSQFAAGATLFNPSHTYRFSATVVYAIGSTLLPGSSINGIKGIKVTPEDVGVDIFTAPSICFPVICASSQCISTPSTVASVTLI